MSQPYLSVLIPAYNEERTLERVIDTVLKVDEDLEIVLIDDGSSDDTWRVMQSRVDGDRVRSVRHDSNRGKGAAIRTGLTQARGHIVLIQDADLEYSPDDYGVLLEPLKTQRATVVYGSRSFLKPRGIQLLVRHGQSPRNPSHQRLIQLLPVGHGNGLQGNAARSSAFSQSARSLGSSLNPRSPPSCFVSATESSKCRSPTPPGLAKEGKKLTATDGVKAVVTLLRFRSWSPTQQ